MKLWRAAVLAVCLLSYEVVATSVAPTSITTVSASTSEESTTGTPTTTSTAVPSSPQPTGPAGSTQAHVSTMSITTEEWGTGTSVTATDPVTASTQTTTTVPTIAMQTQTFPNDVTVQSDKAVMQKAIILSNHISALSAQIIALNSTLDPNNSVLILSLGAMLQNATQMNSTLNSLNSQLATAQGNLQTQQAIYANTSRVMYCMSTQCRPPTTLAPTTTLPFTGTTSAPSCNQTLTACSTDSTFIFNATTAAICSTTVTATGGTVKYTLTNATIPANGKINVIDVGTGVVLKSYATGKTSDDTYLSNRTNLRFDAVPANGLTYSITYSIFNPCDGSCGTSTNCTLNRQGQPICSCSDTSPCATMSGNNCTIIDPCTNRNKNICISNGGTCSTNKAASTCVSLCIPNNPSFLKFHEEEREVREERGFFQRWIF